MDFLRFKAAIFDLDGTLIESNGVWSDIDKEFLGRRGIDVPPDYFKAVSVMNFEAAAHYTNERFSLGENADDIQQEWYDMAIYRYANEIELVKGADSFVRELKERGVRIALATAASSPLYEPVLKRHGIYGCFDFFAATSQVKRGKGFPDVYELAANSLSLSAQECVVFEDIIEGICAAGGAGFFTAARLNSHYQNDWESLKSQSDFYYYDYCGLLIKG